MDKRTWQRRFVNILFLGGINRAKAEKIFYQGIDKHDFDDLPQVAAREYLKKNGYL